MGYSCEVVERFQRAVVTGLGEHKGNPATVRYPAGAATCVDNEGRPAGWIDGEAEDRTLNVWVRFRVKVSAGRICTAEAHVFGCPHTIVAAQWAVEWLSDAPIEQLGRFDVHAVNRLLDVPAEKMGKLLRIEEALQACAVGVERMVNADRP